MGQPFVIAATDYDSCTPRSPENNHSPGIPTPTEPLFAPPCWSRQKASLSRRREGCLVMRRRRIGSAENGSPEWAWKSEGRRRAEWQKVAGDLQDVIFSCALSSDSNSDKVKVCRLTTLLRLIEIYWVVDQLTSRRSSYVEECKSWIIYLQSPHASVQRYLHLIISK